MPATLTPGIRDMLTFFGSKLAPPKLKPVPGSPEERDAELASIDRARVDYGNRDPRLASIATIAQRHAQHTANQQIQAVSSQQAMANVSYSNPDITDGGWATTGGFQWGQTPTEILASMEANRRMQDTLVHSTGPNIAVLNQEDLVMQYRDLMGKGLLTTPNLRNPVTVDTPQGPVEIPFRDDVINQTYKLVSQQDYNQMAAENLAMRKCIMQMRGILGEAVEKLLMAPAERAQAAINKAQDAKGT